ncbi:MAG TPA: multicopper oxidase domain-containing protein, partial [Gemmatimonadales bacterium]|nr:multicopper oxidase domain-containing protein [Gemmatimonadales bacterium]
MAAGRSRVTLKAGLFVLLAAGWSWGTSRSPGLPTITANDNRTPAGQQSKDTLRIRLEVRMGVWYPEADSGPSAEVAAFAEETKAPQIPGPLIRVKTGTIINVTVRNALPDSTISVHGLLTRPVATDDSLVLRPGEVRTVRFTAGQPGTYFYWAVPGRHNPAKDDEREQLSGAFVIDPPQGSPADRILMLNIWGKTIDSANYRNALAINGRSWPYTERIHATVGDTIRWRVINATVRPHPMHLHGFYYSIDASGDGLRDSLYRPEDRRLVVTEDMRPFETRSVSWSPDRPGNWVFHCHIAFHVVPDTRLDPPAADSRDRMAHDPAIHMAGLVMGITVDPRGAGGEPLAVAKREHLFIQEGLRRGRSPRAMGYVLQRGAAPASDSIEVPSALLVLTRGQPTDMVIINRLKEPSAIHWHGIELGSYSDGVAGWSGAGTVLAPSIQPGDSFIAHLILPQAGTFIYHTHMNDLEQLTSGLFGAIVVLEPGKPFDPATDHVYLVGWDGPADPPDIVINGDSTAKPLSIRADVEQRFRFVNIGPAAGLYFAIYRDTSLVTWRALAKD